MYRTLCVLALLTLQAGLVHCFSWDIVVAEKNRLAFYNEGKVTYSVTFIDVDINWITYDPFHNRVLFTNGFKSLLSYDMATGNREALIYLKPIPDINQYTYDPATGLFFTRSSCKLYSYLVKPGSNNEVDANFVIDMGPLCGSVAVDSCTGDIYWISDNQRRIMRARLNGSRREFRTIRGTPDENNRIFSLGIDSQTQNMYWSEYHYYKHNIGWRYQYFVYSADLNGKQIRTIMLENYHKIRLIFSNDDPRQHYNKFFWKIPKNLPIGTDVKPKQIAFNETSGDLGRRYITANYAIEEQPQGIPLCKALKRLLPDYSETSDSDSLNVSTSGSLLRVNETKVNSGESRVSGDTWNVPVCQYYCLQGNCSVSVDGQPKCRCNAGYSGERCETNGCQAYCLHGGVCSLSEQNNPVCQCTGDYQGERCDVPAFLIKCSLQTVSLLKDADLSSVTEGKGVKSTCASTVV